MWEIGSDVRGLVSVPWYAIEFFTVSGVLVVAGSIDSVRDDFVDGKLVGPLFFAF